MTPLTKFFGDGEYSFCLTAPLIIELERTTGTGIGALCARLFAKQFSQAEITEAIRLALVGGGTDPKRAAQMIAAYATDRPISETYPLAIAIAEHVWFGNPHEATNG
jgi:hypothetical protein